MIPLQAGLPRILRSLRFSLVTTLKSRPNLLLARRCNDPRRSSYPAFFHQQMLVDVSREKERQRKVETPEEQADRLAQDGRTPVQKFRTAPKRPLTVTDLTAGQWCELQYEYTLTKLPFGRKVATQAMKGGTKVHKKLELEVHVPVKVTVTTREDGFGLRLWNIVQGLRTLRDIGMTRELEVWGVEDGYIVNGIIDKIHVEYASDGSEEGDLKKQSKITEHFSSSTSAQDSDWRVFITDVKTTSAKRLPSGGALRPTKIQLYLYHRFLSDIAGGKLDLFKVFERYSMDPDSQFSDSYLAQVADIHPEILKEMGAEALHRAQEQKPSTSPPGGSSIRYRNLRDMVPLFQDEIRKTFPRGAQNIDASVTVEYRSRENGEISGTRVFEVSKDELQPLVDKYMQWWTGKRPANGVPIEEVYKCRICDFADSCTWREAIDQANLSRIKAKLEKKSSP